MYKEVAFGGSRAFLSRTDFIVFLAALTLIAPVLRQSEKNDPGHLL